ncbi:hypothetical protein HD806DRAFT_540348 [Xylariaceae sp. AK1471]|nr:hypothetical protein HD806DRAFT_540348 [Xylariaceae sp. AK1471]
MAAEWRRKGNLAAEEVKKRDESFVDVRAHAQKEHGYKGDTHHLNKPWTNLTSNQQSWYSVSLDLYGILFSHRRNWHLDETMAKKFGLFNLVINSLHATLAFAGIPCCELTRSTDISDRFPEIESLKIGLTITWVEKKPTTAFNILQSLNVTLAEAQGAMSMVEFDIT